MNERIVIYTAQVGYTKKIELHRPYNCPVDWKGIHLSATNFSRQDSRKIKILGHEYVDKDYDIYIWIDSTEFFIDDVRPYVKKYLSDADWCTLTEQPKYGTTLYKNAQASVDVGRNSPGTVRLQLERYREEGVPEDTPVYQNSMVMRRRTPKVTKVSEAWWQEYNLSIHPDIGFGDQTAFAYVAWKSGIRVNRMSYEDQRNLIGQIPYTGWRMTNEGAKCE